MDNNQSYHYGGGGGGSSSRPTGTGMRMARGATPNSTRTNTAIRSIAPSTDRNVPLQGLPNGAQRGRVLSGRVTKRDATTGAVPSRRSPSRTRDVSLFKRTRSRLIF